MYLTELTFTLEFGTEKEIFYEIHEVSDQIHTGKTVSFKYTDK